MTMMSVRLLRFAATRSHFCATSEVLRCDVARALAAPQRLLSTSAPSHSSSSSSSDDGLVLCEVENNIAVITLNDPARLNALTEKMGDELVQTIEELNRNSAIRAAILTGSGDAFSAGGDLKFLKARMQTPSKGENVRCMLNFYDRFLTIRKLNVPVIAAINGPAIGAGMCLAAACDMRVVVESATLGYTFAKLGIHPGMGASHFTAQVFGQQMANYLLLTGETMSGRQALQHGFALDSSKTASTTLSKAMSVAESIAHASPDAVRETIISLRARQEIGLRDSLLREASAQGVNFAEEGIKEGIQAILEKRAPKH